MYPRLSLPGYFIKASICPEPSSTAKAAALTSAAIRASGSAFLKARIAGVHMSVSPMAVVLSISTLRTWAAEKGGGGASFLLIREKMSLSIEWCSLLGIDDSRP